MSLFFSEMKIVKLGLNKRGGANYLIPFAMPRFSQADEAFLKRTMLPRAPACFFTSEDVEMVMKETGMGKPVVKNWEKCLRFRLKLSNKLPSEIEEYLKSSPEPHGKVI